jgi:hypothetical protein
VDRGALEAPAYRSNALQYHRSAPPWRVPRKPPDKRKQKRKTVRPTAYRRHGLPAPPKKGILKSAANSNSPQPKRRVEFNGSSQIRFYSEEDWALRRPAQRLRLSTIENTESRLLVFEGLLHGKPARFLLDCGASGHFVSTEWQRKHKVHGRAKGLQDEIILADGSKRYSSTELRSATISMGDTYTTWAHSIQLPSQETLMQC